METKQLEIVVGCDADGILTDLSAHNLREGEKTFNRKPINKDGYSIEEIFNLKDVSKLILYLKAFKIYTNYCKNEKPRNMAPKVIKCLSKDNFVFHSITARKFATNNDYLGKLARKWFHDWLNKYEIEFSSFNYCSEENSSKDKLLACKKLNVDVMIEDRPDIALNLAQNGIKVILIDTPYNKKVEDKNIIRVNDWNDIKIVLENIKRNKKEIPFLKKEKEEIEKLSLQEKEEYFNSYKIHLKKLFVNNNLFRKGDKKFKLIYSAVKFPIKLIYKIKVFGKENVPFQNGFIVASNHNDSTDQYRIGLALGNRPFVGYAAKEIENTFRGKLFKSTGLGVFVDRNDLNDKKNASELMAKYVSHDRIALIFPEGTRKNKTPDGFLKFQNRFKLGTVALAQKTGTGILPTAVNAFGNDTVISFGEMMYVNSSDNLIDVNNKLELVVANLNWSNIQYYYRDNEEKLKIEYEKYIEYVKELDVEVKTEHLNRLGV